ELCGQHGPDQRAGPGDGGEVMAESDPAIGWDVIASVAETDRGREVAIVEFQHSGGDEIGVEAIGQGVDTYRGDYEPQHVGAVLAACTCENRETGSTPARNRYPDEDPASPHDRSQSPAFLFQSKFTLAVAAFTRSTDSRIG